MQHKTTEHNTTQQNTTTRPDTCNTRQQNTREHNTSQDITTQHKTSQHNTTQHITRHHRLSQDITGYHKTTEHKTTQHKTRQHKTTHHKWHMRGSDSTSYTVRECYERYDGMTDAQSELLMVLNVMQSHKKAGQQLYVSQYCFMWSLVLPHKHRRPLQCCWYMISSR
jgi:hypothetical protein